MKFIALFTTFCCAAATYQDLFDAELDEYWMRYKSTYGKSYRETEDVKRRLIFEKRVADIVRHNLQADLGMHTYYKGVNAFTDVEHSEFVRSYNGYRSSDILQNIPRHWDPLPNTTKLPDTVDWTLQGYVTDVKDQKQCGSCWAFASTGALEGQHMKKNGTLVSLSEQQLIDCSGKYGNKGCDGGWSLAAYEYVSRNGGIDTEASYPYMAVKGPACLYNNQTIGATCWNFRVLPGGNEDYLKEAIAEVGPISVSIDASHESFQTYKSGIYHEPNCTISNLDHAVLVVGYGTEKGLDYWLVKNSYGKSWGMQGYIKMSRNRDDECGIARDAIYPMV